LTSSRFVVPVSAELVTAEVEVAGERFAAVGLGGVIVNAECRGRGLARRVIQEALDRARTMGPAFVILFCHGDRVGLYERLGFSQVGSPISVRQPNGFVDNASAHDVVSLHPQASWPTGIVIVHDLPF
jgi:predicted N-acetyltransferase YhbS